MPLFAFLSMLWLTGPASPAADLWPRRVHVAPGRMHRGRTAAVRIIGFSDQPVELRILNYQGLTVWETRLLPACYVYHHRLRLPGQLGPGNYLVLLQAEERPWQARTWLMIR
ncbi:hypothetical protein [Hymenobacter jeollabukensis]|uniref:DUF3244 domain-containing protein n=1 Tax=Hymenobacter jeollabukensis TaxID=2025313 RepID=A0A5R8WJC2_9BACT|nr:hypothetical protein [Hymenobacter jeollabukensis]TLM88761.1 hypothetical protein FDY95_23290 [Hymenobacter jeollabukensis]